MIDKAIPVADIRIVFREVLEEKCVNLSKLARKLGYSPSYLNKIVELRKELPAKLRQELNDFLGTSL